MLILYLRSKLNIEDDLTISKECYEVSFKIVLPDQEDKHIEGRVNIQMYATDQRDEFIAEIFIDEALKGNINVYLL